MQAEIIEFTFDTLDAAADAARAAGVNDEQVLTLLQNFATNAEGMDHGRATVLAYHDEQVLEVSVRVHVWPKPTTGTE